ncbi:hypothetical protein CXB49_10965 [Chromobacterium sp. ATCC 53434]|nr:hypothetical protein CXB49_10965 [Chromobacterium sp. ATCC 53434]
MEQSMHNNVLGWNGERLDPVSGATHLGNGYRAYSPALMRFHSPDSLSPFGAGGVNPYAYCAGDPVNRADPSGHLSWQAWAMIGVGIAGLGLAAITKGVSIIAAGGIIAALESASAMSLAIGGAAIMADVAAIACGATEEINPQASAVLGWVSLGAGAVGLAHGAAGLTRALNKTTEGLRFRLGKLMHAGLSGRGAEAAAAEMAGASSIMLPQDMLKLPPELQLRIIQLMDLRTLKNVMQSGDSPISRMATEHFRFVRANRSNLVDIARILSYSRKHTNAFLSSIKNNDPVTQLYARLGALKQLDDKLPIRGYSVQAVDEAYRKIINGLPEESAVQFQDANQQAIRLQDISPPNAELKAIFNQAREIPVPLTDSSIPYPLWRLI